MIPIFRGKHYRDNIYFIGSLIGKDDEYYIIQDEDMEYYRPIDITTLAIHFPDMLDSQGNKIFASLSEDGKGGDTVNLDERCGENFNAVALYRYYEIHLKGGVDLLNRAKYLRCYPKKDIKVIGIQE